jgi:hypothetical protein
VILKADRADRLTALDLDATPRSSVVLVDQADADKVDRREQRRSAALAERRADTG